MTQTKAELLQTRHQGDIRLGDANSSHYVGFKAPATVGSNLVWTLPAADGTANYLLKTDGSGNLGWVADSSTDSTKMPLAGGTFTGNTIYNDNAKAIFGTSSDGVEIYHSGSGSYIKDSGTGDLIINSNTIRLKNAANDEHLAIFDQNSYCSLYYDNVKKFETYGSGIKAYNHVRVEGLEGENAVLALYADEGDDAADLWIMAANTSGALEIQQWNGSAWEDVIKATGGGAVELFYNDVKTFETIATGATITSSATTGITFTKPSGSAPQIQFRANSVDAASEIKVSESLGGGILEVKTKTTGGTLTTALTLDASQNATFAGRVDVGGELHIDGTYPLIELNDTDSNSDWQIRNANGEFALRDITNSANRFTITSAGTAEFPSSSGTVSISAGTVSDSIGELRQIPQRSVSSVTLAASDVGKAVLATSTVTVPNGVFSSGDAVTIINNSGSDITISKGISTMYLASDGSSANRTLATRGMATIWFSSSSVAYISGAGLS